MGTGQPCHYEREIKNRRGMRKALLETVAHGERRHDPALHCSQTTRLCKTHAFEGVAFAGAAVGRKADGA